MQEKSKKSQFEDCNEEITLSELGNNLGLQEKWKALEAMEVFEETFDFEDSLEGKSIKEIVEFRFNQSDYSRLAEYITGLRPENPKILDKLVYDKEKIRYKYGLPSIDWIIENPTEYERFLRDIAKKNNRRIRDRSDCSNYFLKETDVAGAYFYKTKAIGADIDKTDESAYLISLATLEHEIIHSIQDAKFSTLPFEIIEYEAYLANFDLEYYLEEASDFMVLYLFRDVVGDSVIQSYMRSNQIRNKYGLEMIEPEWINPEFFLKNVDGIDSKEIEKYMK